MVWARDEAAKLRELKSSGRVETNGKKRKRTFEEAMDGWNNAGLG